MMYGFYAMWSMFYCSGLRVSLYSLRLRGYNSGFGVQGEGVEYIISRV